MGRSPTHQIPSNLTLNASRDGASTASMGNLCQSFITFWVKSFLLTPYLNLPSFSLTPLPLVLLLSDHEKDTCADPIFPQVERLYILKVFISCLFNSDCKLGAKKSSACDISPHLTLIYLPYWDFVPQHQPSWAPRQRSGLRWGSRTHLLSGVPLLSWYWRSYTVLLTVVKLSRPNWC